MRRFFFDRLIDGERLSDDEGQDLSASELRNEAIFVLHEIAREVVPDGDHHKFKVTVRRSDDARNRLDRRTDNA